MNELELVGLFVLGLVGHSSAEPVGPRVRAVYCVPRAVQIAGEGSPAVPPCSGAPARRFRWWRWLLKGGSVASDYGFTPMKSS